MRPEAVSTKHLGQRSARNSDQYCFFGIKKSHYAQLSTLTLSNRRASRKHTENTPTDIRLTAIYETIELWKQTGCFSSDEQFCFSAFLGRVFSLTRTAFCLHVCKLFIALGNKYLL